MWHLFKISKNKDAFALLSIFIAVFSAYSPVLCNVFSVTDDWYFLHNALTGKVGTVPLLTSAGRPINGLLLDMGFLAAGSVEGLVRLRLVTIIGISFLGSFLYKFSRAHNIDCLTSLWVAIGVVLLPSFHVYASWAQHFTTPYAGILAIFSACIITPGFSIRKRSRTIEITLSSSLLVISLLIYQPIAMLFWTVMLISLIVDLDNNKKWVFSRVLDVFLVFSIAMITSFIVFKFGQFQYPKDTLRYSVVREIFKKLIWFFSEPLANAISLYAVPKSRAFFSMVLTILLISIFFLRCKRGTKFAAKLFSITTFSLFVSYIPNLATAENWASYRSTGALSATTFISILLVLRLTIKNIFKENKSKKIIILNRMISVCSFFLLCFLTQSSVNKGFVLPNVIELNNLAGFLKKKAVTAAHTQSILIKRSYYQDSNVKVFLYDEFGMTTSLTDLFCVPMVKVVLRSMGLFHDAEVLLYSDKLMAEDSALNKSSLIIDFSKLVNSEQFKSKL